MAFVSLLKPMIRTIFTIIIHFSLKGEDIAQLVHTNIRGLKKSQKKDINQ